MKNIFKIVAATAVAVAITQTVQAVPNPINGNIGFSGTAVLDTSDANTATKVITWGTDNVVGSDSGSFVGLVTIGDAVTLLAPWSFNSTGPLNNFWKVDGFTFTLNSSSIFSQVGGFLNVSISGTVSGNGFDTTAFSGSLQLANPSANGATTFTERLSFNSVPDGGTTVLLLGAALSGLALMKRKFVA